MPRIKLKPKSPEYLDEQKVRQATCICDMPECNEKGHHKAPKNRGLNEYYHFCLQHIREYNEAWDFFDGMNAREIEDHVLKSIYGFRPTWKYGIHDQNPEDILRNKAEAFYNRQEHTNGHSSREHYTQEQRDTPEFEALAIMGLEPPLTLKKIKRRYKELAKKYHPDLNKGCRTSEELLKKINMSYTVLKLAYRGFENLPER